MADLNYFASTLLMGVFLTAIALAITRFRAWQQGSPETRERTGSRLTEVTQSPTAWTVGFLLVSFAFTAGAVLFVGGVEMPQEVRNVIGVALIVAFGGVLLIYLFAGVYLGARNRGLETAHAVAIGSWLLGMLFIAAIAAQLLIAG